ncbi:MucR family transcriptional regulator [Roseomonas hellenica]|uniref:MucR family transcriptional regulator n=1 Tax=Plastoroseomonas hellenica TaxID=2687306 RepID=A0ABS5EWQ0_9PROT|nr:MucR family transcriptional regulator [Plastoroseomonas hellenica]MBR0664732.1 MucR family transcriptional regulator [Plastoroseomonas hellenica]
MHATRCHRPDILALTAEIVAAHVAHNTVARADLPALIQNLHGAFASLGALTVSSSGGELRRWNFWPLRVPLNRGVRCQAADVSDHLSGRGIELVERNPHTTQV